MTNKEPPQILLGFDFGMKRIGVAVGQMVTKTATPLETIKANKGIPDWNIIKKIIKKWQPDAIIVGIPLNMDGTEQPITQDAKHFAESLNVHFQIPVYGMDERLSTKAAREHLFDAGGFKAIQSGQVDSVAAQLILQNWLNQYGEK
jgi:putative Holliday junction resolvase